MAALLAAFWFAYLQSKQNLPCVKILPPAPIFGRAPFPFEKRVLWRVLRIIMEMFRAAREKIWFNFFAQWDYVNVLTCSILKTAHYKSSQWS